MMLGKILRFERRLLHTIISGEIIKPSSPTPSHLHTYNLSPLDQCVPHTYIPLILYYPNNENCSLTPDHKAHELKKSLSQSLTRYYPFAGRLPTPTAPYIDCNDEGVLVVEAKHDCKLNKFQNISDEDDSFGQLFADGMVFQNCPREMSLVGVQLNHFACGGIAVAVSMSHRIGDGCTLGSYVSHWASVARYGSTDHKEVLQTNPHFIQSPTVTNPLTPDQTSILNQRCANRVTRKFVFPNSRLSVLKKKVLAGPTISIDNPTRVEVLTSLIYKTAVAATTPKSSAFKPSFLIILADIRKRFVPKLPKTIVGNLFTAMLVTTRHSSETSLSVVVSEIKKEKMELERIQSPQLAYQNAESFLSRLRNEDLENVANRSFCCSSLCGYRYNNVDFGWGNATAASITFGSSDRIGSVLMDTPDGDGIEARVILEKEHMEIVENDNKLLSFCQN